MYAVTNYQTKKAMIEDVKSGKRVEVWQAGPFGPVVKDGTHCMEGPHYPQPHRWYAEVVVVGGVVTKAK